MSLSLSIYYMLMIIISFTMSLISPILLCAYLYPQFYCVYYYHQFCYVHIIITNSEVPIININFTTSLKLSPISLCVYQHQFYYVYIIITNFAISLPSSSSSSPSSSSVLLYLSLSPVLLSLSLSPILICVYHYHQVWCAYHYHKFYYVSIIITNFTMCPSLSPILLCVHHYHQFYYVPVITNSAMFLSLSPTSLFPCHHHHHHHHHHHQFYCIYHYHQFYCPYHYHQFCYVYINITKSDVRIIIINFTMSLSLSPILLCVHHYHQFYYVSVIITNFTMCPSLSPILLCVHHYHQFYYVSIIITNFTMCLSAQILLCFYHYHQYRDLIVALWSRSHGFEHRQISLGFLMDMVTLEEVVLQIHRFLQVSTIAPRLHIHISFICHRHCGDTRWRSWLMHCATSRKVAGSILRWCHWKFSLA